MEWLALVIPVAAVIALVAMFMRGRSGRRRRPGRDYSDEPSAVVLGAAVIAGAGTHASRPDQEGADGDPGSDPGASPAPSDSSGGGGWFDGGGWGGDGGGGDGGSGA